MDDASQINSLPGPFEANKIARSNDLNKLLAALGGGVALSEAQGGLANYSRTPIRITAATLVEAGRWKYSGKRQLPRKSTAGEDSYVEDETITPVQTITELWNDAEERNLGGFNGTTYGNGIVKADLPTGFTLQAIPVGVVVWAYPVSVDNAGTIELEWRFSSPNGVTGACP